MDTGERERQVGRERGAEVRATKYTFLRVLFKNNWNQPVLTLSLNPGC